MQWNPDGPHLQESFSVDLSPYSNSYLFSSIGLGFLSNLQSKAFVSMELLVLKDDFVFENHEICLLH